MPSAVSNERLKILQEEVTNRMERLHPPEKQRKQDEGAGRWNLLRGWRKSAFASTDVQASDKYHVDESEYMKRLLR